MWKILLGNKCTHRLSCLLFLLSFLQVIMSTHHIIQYKEEFQLGFSFSHTCYILIIIVVMCSGDRFWAYIFVSFLNYFSLSWKIFRNIGKFLVKELVVYCGTWISLAISLAQTALSWETAQQADPAVWPLYLAESYLCLEMRSVWRSHSLQRSFIPKSVPLAFPVVTFALSTPDARHPCQRVRNLLWSATMIVLGRRKWQPTPVFLPGEFHGQRSLAGFSSPWSCKESDTTEQLTHMTIVKIVAGQFVNLECSRETDPVHFRAWMKQ